MDRYIRRGPLPPYRALTQTGSLPGGSGGHERDEGRCGEVALQDILALSGDAGGMGWYVGDVVQNPGVDGEVDGEWARTWNGKFSLTTPTLPNPPF